MRATKRWLLIAGLALTCVGTPRGPAYGQGVGGEPAVVRPDARLAIGRLIDLAAGTAGISVEYNEQELARVPVRTIRVPEGLSPGELWTLANRVLGSANLTTIAVPGSPVLSVVSVEEARRAAPLVREIPAMPRPGYTRFVYRPNERLSSGLVSALAPLAGRDTQVVEIDADAESSVLIEGFTPRVAELAEVLRSLDVAATESGVRRFPSRDVDASVIARWASDVLPRVLGEQDAARLEIFDLETEPGVLIVGPPALAERAEAVFSELALSRPLERRVFATKGLEPTRVAETVRTTVLPAGEGLGSGGRGAMVVPDALTGTVVVTASPAVLADVEAFFERLATLPAAARRVADVFEARHRDPVDLITLLEGLLGDEITVESVGGIGTESDTIAPEPPSAVRRLSGGDEPQLSLIADDAANRVLVSGPDAAVRRAIELLGELDVRERQVALEVTVVSLSEGETFDLGVEIVRTATDGDAIINLASLFGLSDLDLGDGLGAGDAVIGGGGFTGVVLSPGQYSVLLRALETVTDGRTVNRTRLLITNGEEASLTSAVQAPFLQTNASDTVATTSFGGSSSAGLDVSVTPEISSGGYLRLTYNVSLSAFVGESADPALPPPRQESQVSSVSLLPDSHTVAVGGIEIANEGSSQRRVPLLGAIPIIGNAFKNTSESGDLTRFYVFIQPTLVRDTSFEDLRRLSNQELIEAGLPPNAPKMEPEFVW